MDKLLLFLVEKRAALASQALLAPSDKSSFEYGRVSGLYQGLTLAIDELQELQREQEEEDE